jgi:2'-hydroxyisoflavone reductase
VPTNRRTFIKASVAAGGMVGLGALPTLASAREVPDSQRTLAGRAKKPLNILILGGTGFTGPEQVEYAIARGHSVTLINRNKTRPDFFKGRVEQLIGDFNGDMSALKGRKFDVVLDNPTTAPSWIRNASQYLKGNVDHYIFISTLSVYPDNSKAWADESDGLTPMPAGLDPFTIPAAEARKYYGALKTVSEGEVARTYPSHTIIRPGLIVGPLDQTDRFTYWPYRINQGGEVMAPGTPNDPVQFIDSRDLAEWTVRMAEGNTNGVFNATGPDKPLTMAEMLYGIKAVTTAGAQFTWVPADFLAEQKINGWRHMTVWVASTPQTVGFSRRDVSKAVAA